MSIETCKHLLPEDQRHLIAFWDQLDPPQQRHLAKQIESIDFDQVRALFAGEQKATDWNRLAEQATAPEAFRLGSSANACSREQAVEAGRKALHSGKLGVILVAGGQGSRLGFDHPKGMYPIGPLSQRTLFQFHVEQLRALANRFGVSIPLYLMTSPATHTETVEFLEQHDRFGMAPADLHIFCQGTMPAVDRETGKLLLASPGEVFTSPDGHGGTLAALQNSGLLEQIDARGIEHLFYFQVDNPLVEICQPEFVGYHVLAQSELSTQVVCKSDPMEKVGNVVSVGDQMMIIEYSDLPDHLADRKDEQGLPIFWAGNIAVHVFAVEFLSRAASNSEMLPFHRAVKAVPHINTAGELVAPEEPNAIKFERFIFDLMPWAKHPIVVEVDAKEVFAPLKNASGAARDTPEATREAIVAKHRRMLETAGATVKDDVRVEVNPLFALDSDELKEKISDTLFISSDQYFDV